METIKLLTEANQTLHSLYQYCQSVRLASINNEPAKHLDIDDLDDIKLLGKQLQKAIEEADNEIHLIWSVDDVITRAEHRIEEESLVGHPVPTKEQAREILQAVFRRHDANLGVNWETIEVATEMYFQDLKKEVSNG